jgi:GNAT superfamily N-acetyltransferase
MLSEWIKDYRLTEEGYECFESTFGFCFYKVQGEEFFINDFYIARELRGNGRNLERELISIAKQRGCKILTGNVYCNDDGRNFATKLMKMILGVGWKVNGFGKNCVMIYKEID